jgi:tRNA threonylcarbamoyladenosine biosynthesis protein TsaB
MPAPILLAIDTATEVCSVALAVGATVAEHSETVGNAHSARLLPMIDALLARHALRLQDCDAIAFGAGPGSFTGLRIACAVAQGLAFGARKPVIAIGSLAALAADAISLRADSRRVLAAIDARMGEVYWAVYDNHAGRPLQIAAPALVKAADLPALARRHAADTLAGNALALHPEIGAAGEFVALPQAAAGARRVAELALVAYAAGEVLPPEAAAPIYVRDRVALTVAERRSRVLAAG